MTAPYSNHGGPGLGGPGAPRSLQRPLPMRLAFLGMGCVILFVAARRIYGQYHSGEEITPQAVAIPLVMAIALGMQFFAKERGSKLQLLSLVLVVVCLILMM